MTTEPVLSVRDLHTVVDTSTGTLPIVRGVSFDVAAGETVALVGESGSGKSMTMLSIMGLHPRQARISQGTVRFEGTDLTQATPAEYRAVRGKRMAMVYQDPMTSLNPLMRIGDQITEVQTAHGVGKREAKAHTQEVLGAVGIPRPDRAARAYPHEYSGGMRQRVAIAMALALEPTLLIADEPTTALDVTIQQQIVALVADLQRQLGIAVVWITHDLALVARVASRTMVMYAGRIVESDTTKGLFQAASHPYTAGLLDAIPAVTGRDRGPLAQIGGHPPAPGDLPPGCAFEPRCAQSIDRCLTEDPELTSRDSGKAACWVPRSRWT